ncbi:MAG: ABC transporter ATP-binding protein, partial [Clostridia bacterium]|nr:ABC transporter ATP-binding protein [Clostridia bacterium]
MTKPSQKAILKRIFKQLKHYKFLIFLTIFFALISVAGNLLIPIYFGNVVDLLIEGQAVDFNKIFEYFIFIAAFIASSCLAQWLMSIINNRITYKVVKDIREEAFAKIQNLPLKFIDAHSYGDIVGRNIADVDQFADGLLMGFTQLFTGVLTIVGTLGIMLYKNWIIALVVFVITPLSLFAAKFIASHTYSLFKKTSEIRGEQTAFIDEMIGNLKVVQAFGREYENLEKFDEINGRLTKASLKSIFYSSLTNPVTRFVNSVVYAAVALSGALLLVSNIALPVAFSVGGLTSLLFYANQYTKPFNEISGVITELQNAIACAGRIYELIDEPPQPPDSENAIVLENVNGDVEFENVYFSY